MMKTLKLLSIVFVFIFLLLIFIFKIVNFELSYLEYDFFVGPDPKIKVIMLEDNEMLLVKGYALHSHPWAQPKKIFIKKSGKNGEELSILVKLGAYSEHKSIGKVFLSVGLSDDIERVTFGKKKAILWERNKKTEALEPNNSD